jgi:quinoprotein glucose dehydrogenase
MEALAKLSYDEHPDLEAIEWRALNANRMIGQTENGEAVVNLAEQANHPASLRIEALEIVGEWLAPHGQCRVVGNWRPCQHPNGDIVRQNFAGAAGKLLTDPVVAEATARALAKLGVTSAAASLVAAVHSAALPAEARLAALDALAEMKAAELTQALDGIAADAPVALRQRAVALLSHTSPEKAVPVLASLLANGNTGEKQAALEALGDMQVEAATAQVRKLLGDLARDAVDPALRLDVLEAAAKHPALKEPLAAVEAAATAKGELGPWLVCRDGGNSGAGRSIFHDNEATRCTRCHSLGGQGGNAGPALDGIGKKLTRDQLLEALVTPNARIAEGFGTTTVDLHDGTMLVGVITKDQDGAITIVPATGEATEVPWSRIKARTPNAASAMPKMAGPLSRRQLRDVVEFLSRQKKD